MKVILLIFITSIAYGQVNEFYYIAGKANNTDQVYDAQMIYDVFSQQVGNESHILADPSPLQGYIQTEEGEWVFDVREDWDRELGKKRVFTQQEMESLWAFSPHFTKIKKKEDIEVAFESTKEKSYSRIPLIFIGNHGGAPQGPSEYIERDVETGIVGGSNLSRSVRLSSTISMEESKESININSLRKMIKKNFDSNDQIRIIGTQCFSGSIHEVAFMQDNVCSAAVTDWITVSYATDAEGPYVQGMSSEISAKPDDKKFDLNGDGSTSLQEAHLAGIANDNLNWGRGQLSSMAYVDMVLKEGVYANEIPTEYYNPANDPELNQEESIDCVVCLDRRAFPYEIEGFVDSIEQIQENLLQGLYVPQAHQLTSEELNALPKELQATYENFLKSDLLNLKTAFKTQERVVRLQEKSDRLQRQFERSFDDESRKLLEELNQVQNDLRKELSPLKGMINYFQHLKKVARFYKEASSKQKKKYESLLDCEMGIL